MKKFSFQVEHRDTKTKARLGTITTAHGEILTPAFATSCGLLLHGGKMGKGEQPSLLSGIGKIGTKVQIKGIAGKMIDLVKSFMP